MELVLFCLGSCGGCLGGVMVLGMSFYVMMWVLVMGCVLWWGSLLMMLDWGWDGGDNVPCSGGVLLHSWLVVGLAG